MRPGRVTRLVLVATTPSFVQREDWPHARSVEELARFGDELRVSYRLTLQRFLALQVHGSEEGRATLALLRERLFERGEPSPATLAGVLALLQYCDLRPALARVTIPALVVAGDRDTLVPLEATLELAAALPKATHVTIRRCRACAVSLASRGIPRRRITFHRWLSRRFRRARSARRRSARAVRRGFARAQRPRTMPARKRCGAGNRRAGWRSVSITREARHRRRFSMPAAAPAVRWASSACAIPVLAWSRSTSRCRWSSPRAAARMRGRTELRRLLRPFASARTGTEPAFVCADIDALPFAGVSFDLVWSNLALQWVNDLPRAFAEFRRVLKVGGLLSCSRLSAPTRCAKCAPRSRASTAARIRTGFIDMHDVGDMLVHAGFADPVMDMEYVTLTFETPHALLAELKAIGATNRTRGRPHGLMGRARWSRAMRRLEALAKDGRIPATFEVVYGHAWKGEPRRTAEGHAIVRLQRPRAR